MNVCFHQAIGISGKSSRLQQIFTWCLKTFNNAIAGALLNFPKERNGAIALWLDHVDERAVERDRAEFNLFEVFGNYKLGTANTEKP